MALPSQTSSGAPGGRGRIGRGRRRRGGRRRLAIVAIVLVAAGGATLWLLRPNAREAKADTTLAINQPKQNPPPHELQPRREAERPAARQPAPVELSQRRGSPALPEPDPSRQEEDHAGSATAAPAVPAPAPVPAPQTTRAGGSEVMALIQVGEERLNTNDPVGARRLLNDALRHPQATEADRATVRSLMSQINEDLVFSPRLISGDPLVETYTIQSGDSLAKIANRLGLAVDYRFLARVNRLSSPDRISQGQTLKLVRGPFHAVVSKSAYRMDIYAGPGENPAEWLYITSRRVGLGEGGGTPTGVFVVRRDSKLINPHWVNPRTGEQFDADDPKNPIGERWIGLKGLGDAAAFAGYGIHGTIDPESIGNDRSMGCVRMLPDDVELVYEMLAEDVSYVHIVP